ncbi:MAG: tripartite tricarboxylate transporter permease [Bacillota bacterium]
MELMLFDQLQQIPNAFLSVFTFQNLIWILLGSLLGTVFGAAPGLTATTAVALFTPATFYMPLEQSLSFLLGMYCSGYWAGSIPAILINTPGAPGNAATTMDGYPMAKKGKAGEALGHSIVASWIGGTTSAFALLIFAPLIGALALKFGAAEYFSVGVLGLLCVSGISGGSILKGVAGAVIGMLLGAVGMDPIGGEPRFTFDNVNLMGGIALVPALVGFFAITEVLSRSEGGVEKGVIEDRIKRTLPDLRKYLVYKWTLIRSIIIGIIVGALPGTGPTVASWMSYNEAIRNSKDPKKFGKGSTEGLIACESANNSVTGGALIPLLTLGIPGDTVTAVLLGALMIQGLTPGPMLIQEQYSLVSELLWILIIANLFMLVIGLLGSRICPYILKLPVEILMPLVTVLCVVGGYAVNNSFFDVKMLIVVGIVGFVLMKFGFPIPPIVLGLILGPIIEPNLRRALSGSEMNPLVFVTRPLSAIILALALALVVFVIIRAKRERKSEKGQVI